MRLTYSLTGDTIVRSECHAWYGIIFLQTGKRKNMGEKLVFISHITEESQLAQIISKAIKKSYLGMLDTFVSSDNDSIPSGDRWIEKISNALESSVLMLVLCSHQSINRPWINFEAGAAWVRKIPVIPVCHSDFSKDNLPIPLALFQSCDIDKENDLRKV